MNTHEETRIRQLLRHALPSMRETEPGRDIWPAVRHKLETRPTPPPWFDWALAGGLIAFAAFAPATIPVLLYYL